MVTGFGEASPEAKAAMNLQNFFNYVAVRIVLAQLEVIDIFFLLVIFRNFNFETKIDHIYWHEMRRRGP